MVGFFCSKRIFFSCSTKQMIPSGQDRPISTSRVANQNTGFASFCRLEVFAASVLGSSLVTQFLLFNSVLQARLTITFFELKFPYNDLP